MPSAPAPTPSAVPADAGSPATPAVSIVTATRNRPQWIEACLASIAQQTLADFESIVEDDGSDASVLEQYDRFFPALGGRFILHKPAVPGGRGSGPAAARNRGAEAARGRYVTFLDDDDRWVKPDHLALAVELMDRHDADLYFTNMQGEDAGSVKIPEWFPLSPWLTEGRRVHDTPAVYEVSLDAFARAMRHQFPHPDACVFRRSLLETVGLFWTRSDISEDNELVLRAGDGARKILYRPDPVVGYNVTPRSSAFSRVSAVDRSLTYVTTFQRARTVLAHGCTRTTARSIEAWHLRELSRLLLAEGRRPAAASMAWQALCIYPTLGGARAVLRSLRPGRGSLG